MTGAPSRDPDPYAHIPSVSGGNLFGHAGEFRDERQRLALLCRAAATAPLVKMRFLYRTVLVASAPEMLREVLVEQASSFEKSPATRLLLRPLAGEGLFTSEGEHWKSQRRLMSPLFHSSQLASYTSAMNRVAIHATRDLKDGEALDLAPLMTRITMGVVGTTLFGAETFDAADELGHALTTTLQWVDDNLATSRLTLQLSLTGLVQRVPSSLPPLVASLRGRMLEALRNPVLLPGVRAPELVHALQVLDAYIAKMISERRGKASPGDRVDLLTKLLLARDTEPDPSALSALHAIHAGGMTDEQVRDEAMTLFIAGHETTANALAWSFYLLARNPEARARVQAEADSYGPEGVTRFDPARLAYTTRVFKEALRLYPPLIVLGRRAIAPFALGGVGYPRGTLLFINVYGMHHHDRVWDGASRFDPDRFLPEAEAERHKCAWVPFGVGPRVCIGNAFALMEGPIVMATLMRRMSFDIDDKRVIEPDAFATLRPKGGIPGVVRLRPTVDSS